MSLPPTFEALNKAFPNCARYGSYPCEFNERTALLALEIEAVTGVAPKVAALAATQHLASYSVLSDPRSVGETLDFANARQALAQFRAAQAQRKAA